MSDTTYHIENASSGRAKCKKCKETIAKGELRIATNAVKEGHDYTMTSYNHPKCFHVPPRALKGVSPEDFVEDHLEDRTDDTILSDETKLQEIVEAIAYKPPRASKGGKTTGDESAVSKKIAEFKAAMEKLPDESDSEEERPAKKAKKGEGVDIEACARAMKVYAAMKVDELKEVLRWNLGYGTSGNKDILMLRCIDGHVNGRLARCPTCFKGKLNLKDDDAGATILCKGYFDEDAQGRVPCAYTVPVASAPRLQPWYSEEPTEEQMEAMKAITEKSEALVTGGGGGDVPQELVDAAEELDWPDADTAAGKKERTQLMIDLCTSGKTQIDLPQDEKKARMAVGKMIINNPESTAPEVLELVFKEFGLAAAKAEAKANKESAYAKSCTVAANAPVVGALAELGDLYFKEQNANAGGTYKRVVAALVALEFEVTADNAKGLSKGKTKVPGVGKGSADKIYEFLTTGTIQKLEEKRAVHS